MTTLEEKLGQLLTSKHQTIATAESCTGGLIAHRLTNVAGSSAYMMGGVVSYSNEAKQQFVQVAEATLIEFGAVSAETAQEMAVGARQVFGTDFALSVTGIAGPGGATEDKPVGLTFIGLAGPDDLVEVERHVWGGNRVENKIASADAALQLAIRHLLG